VTICFADVKIPDGFDELALNHLHIHTGGHHVTLYGQSISGDGKWFKIHHVVGKIRVTEVQESDIPEDDVFGIIGTVLGNVVRKVSDSFTNSGEVFNNKINCATYIYNILINSGVVLNRATLEDMYLAPKEYGIVDVEDAPTYFMNSERKVEQEEKKYVEEQKELISLSHQLSSKGGKSKVRQRLSQLVKDKASELEKHFRQIQLDKKRMKKLIVDNGSLDMIVFMSRFVPKSLNIDSMIKIFSHYATTEKNYKYLPTTSQYLNNILKTIQPGDKLPPDQMTELIKNMFSHARLWDDIPDSDDESE